MPEDIVDQILRDHREMLRLGSRLRSRPDCRRVTSLRLDELVREHVRAVERYVRPLVRRELAEERVDERTRLVDRRMECLLERLARSAPGAEYEATSGRMVDAVTEHIRFEEAEILPYLRGPLAPEHLESLGDLYRLTRDGAPEPTVGGPRGAAPAADPLPEEPVHAGRTAHRGGRAAPPADR